MSFVISPVLQEKRDWDSNCQRRGTSLSHYNNALATLKLNTVDTTLMNCRIRRKLFIHLCFLNEWWILRVFPRARPFPWMALESVNFFIQVLSATRKSGWIRDLPIPQVCLWPYIYFVSVFTQDISHYYYKVMPNEFCI